RRVGRGQIVPRTDLNDFGQLNPKPFGQLRHIRRLGISPAHKPYYLNSRSSSEQKCVTGYRRWVPGIPISAKTSLPTKGLARGSVRAFFGTAIVTVTLARTAAPCGSPVSAWRPEGMSTATTAAGVRLIQS